ncbi:MAG: hypothetical protein WBD62_02470 [Anaerolineales bacterium]
MMLVSIKSEHGGSLQVNSLSLMPVSQGYRSGIGEQIVRKLVTFILWSSAAIYSSSSPRCGDWDHSVVMKPFGPLHR